MIVHRIDFSLDRLERVNADIGKRADDGVVLSARCSFECTVRPDVLPAACAMDQRAVGQIVGEVEGGIPAIRALYLDADGSLTTQTTPRASG